MNTIIVVPTDDNKGLKSSVAEHFGRCLTYTFLDGKGKVIKIIKNTSEHMGGFCSPPELMKEHGANILLCKDLGPKALDLCGQLEIDVYVNEARTAEKIFELWRSNKLKKANPQDACEQHKL